MFDEKETKSFGIYLDRTTRLIRLNFLNAFKSIGVDITTEQWVVLSSLYQQNGQSQKDIADTSFKNAPTVSRIIDLLCEKGLTERQRFDGDRRRYKVFLTAKGKEIVEKAFPIVLDLRKKGWEGLSDEDYEIFLRIINRVFENFNAIA